MAALHFERITRNASATAAHTPSKVFRSFSPLLCFLFSSLCVKPRACLEVRSEPLIRGAVHGGDAVGERHALPRGARGGRHEPEAAEHRAEARPGELLLRPGLRRSPELQHRVHAGGRRERPVEVRRRGAGGDRLCLSLLSLLSLFAFFLSLLSLCVFVCAPAS